MKLKLAGIAKIGPGVRLGLIYILIHTISNIKYQNATTIIHFSDIKITFIYNHKLTKTRL